MPSRCPTLPGCSPNTATLQPTLFSAEDELNLQHELTREVHFALDQDIKNIEDREIAIHSRKAATYAANVIADLKVAAVLPKGSDKLREVATRGSIPVPRQGPSPWERFCRALPTPIEIARAAGRIAANAVAPLRDFAYGQTAAGRCERAEREWQHRLRLAEETQREHEFLASLRQAREARDLETGTRVVSAAGHRAPVPARRPRSPPTTAGSIFSQEPINWPAPPPTIPRPETPGEGFYVTGFEPRLPTSSRRPAYQVGLVFVEQQQRVVSPAAPVADLPGRAESTAFEAEMEALAWEAERRKRYAEHGYAMERQPKRHPRRAVQKIVLVEAEKAENAVASSSESE